MARKDIVWSDHLKDELEWVKKIIMEFLFVP